METRTIRVLIFPEGGRWVAQCMEHDIATQARTLEALFPQIEATINATIEIRRRKGLPGIESIPRAPERYWHALEHAVEIRWPEHRWQPEPTIPRLLGKVGDLVPA